MDGMGIGNVMMKWITIETRWRRSDKIVSKESVQDRCAQTLKVNGKK